MSTQLELKTEAELGLIHLIAKLRRHGYRVECGMVILRIDGCDVAVDLHVAPATEEDAWALVGRVLILHLRPELRKP